MNTFYFFAENSEFFACTFRNFFLTLVTMHFTFLHDEEAIRLGMDCQISYHNKAMKSLGTNSYLLTQTDSDLTTKQRAFLATYFTRITKVGIFWRLSIPPTLCILLKQYQILQSVKIFTTLVKRYVSSFVPYSIEFKFSVTRNATSDSFDRKLTEYLVRCQIIQNNSLWCFPISEVHQNQLSLPIKPCSRSSLYGLLASDHDNRHIDNTCSTISFLTLSECMFVLRRTFCFLVSTLRTWFYKHCFLTSFTHISLNDRF